MNEYTRFARDLLRAAAGMEESAEAAVERVSRAALVTAQRVAPVDTGELRRGIRVTRQGARATVSVTSFYATFQEFGTTRMPPNPYIGPAFDRHAPELVREVEVIRDDVVRKIRNP